MTTKPHIVVVDDEPDIRETLEEYLQLQGFRVTCADGGEALRRIVEAEPCDLVILDISMPGEDGLSLARFLRATTTVGIIMLTAAGEVVDRIVGLEIGADDYLAKPVDLRELRARIKAVLRRATAEGDEIPITAMEFDLLKAFAEHPNRVLTRDQLLDMAHNRGWEPFDRSIDIRIARLRRKVEDDPAKPQVIKTVRGAGYIFATGGA